MVIIDDLKIFFCVFFQSKFLIQPNEIFTGILAGDVW